MEKKLRRYEVILEGLADGICNISGETEKWRCWAENMEEAETIADLEAKARFVSCHVGTVEYKVRSVKLATNQ